MMRQAGRYLPEFRKLRDKYDFFTRCQTPELATEITLQPIRIIKPDAAILFSDILVVPQAMGVNIQMREGLGPYISPPVRASKQIKEIRVPNIQETLGYVLEAIKMTNRELAGEVPLIGFSGAPWTILCYLVQGQGSKTFDKAKEFCFSNVNLAEELLQKITDTTIAYLKEKVKAGCHVIQIFDSWGGVLSPKDHKIFSWKYINQIVVSLADIVPVIVFAKGCWYTLEEMASSKASALGIDWTCPPHQARKLAGEGITLQGNLDPARLLSPIAEIQKMTVQMIREFGKDRYIANLGHGMLPHIPVDHARAFVDTVKSYNS
ncbi:uroporphyrinogen decarboxylase [Elysia marginata]|uniref:Uroporphyrinogen decarboxylase n=1 Tax=Elysia marginata TaxID=1093978 RepID=A0AAV4F6J6_9GAST|nr:uroporphyrinogen decarboxylase [Elysia marginata]